MHLADFILSNLDEILVEWDAFAQRIWPQTPSSPREVRNHAKGMLRAIAMDMRSTQSESQKAAKSRGFPAVAGSTREQLLTVSRDHACERANSGFGIMAVVSEYRALRATILRLWGDSAAVLGAQNIADIARFNEAVDESLTEAIRGFTETLDQSREIFLGILGHDLRCPLNAIMMSAQDLTESAGAGSENGIIASHITASADAMGSMLKDFLDFTASRLGLGMPITAAPTDLGTICNDVLTEFRTAYPDRTLLLELKENLPGCWDATRLRQLISNLLGNALHHGSRDGPIRLAARGDGTDVRLLVHNTGAPIPPEILPRIFDPLVRGPASSRVAGSMGLGLYIARQVATAHGGSIAVESSSTHGTTFTVSLPASMALS